MLNQLYLIRHGRAVDPGTPGIADDDRPLIPDGERRARQVGRGLKRLGVKVDRIASSPLPRARRTAELIAEAMGAADRLGFDDALRAGADAASVADWLSDQAEGRLMVVGHNPTLSDLVTLLVSGPGGRPIVELRKAGVAALLGDPASGYRVDWFARPRMFRV